MLCIVESMCFFCGSVVFGFLCVKMWICCMVWCSSILSLEIMGVFFYDVVRVDGYGVYVVLKRVFLVVVSCVVVVGGSVELLGSVVIVRLMGGCGVLKGVMLMFILSWFFRLMRIVVCFGCCVVIIVWLVLIFVVVMSVEVVVVFVLRMCICLIVLILFLDSVLMILLMLVLKFVGCGLSRRVFMVLVNFVW